VAGARGRRRGRGRRGGAVPGPAPRNSWHPGRSPVVLGGRRRPGPGRGRSRARRAAGVRTPLGRRARGVGRDGRHHSGRGHHRRGHSLRRRLQAAGNDAALIGWSLATSGVASVVALALVVAVGSGLTGSVLGAVGAALASLAAIVPMVAVLSAMHHRAARELLLRAIDRVSRWLGGARRSCPRPSWGVPWGGWSRASARSG
jgi:hypothetical protein